MSRKTSQFDGSLAIDGFASTFLVVGASALLFAVVVIGLVSFQSSSTKQLTQFHEQNRREQQEEPSVDILGPGVNAAPATANR